MTPTRTPIPTGLVIPSQVPLDNKLYFLNENSLIDLGISNNLAYSYYKGMLVYCAEEETNYIWKEIQVGEIGLLPANFTYPSNWIKEGIDYSNKSYNFIKGIKDYNIINIGSGIEIYKEQEVLNNQTIFKLRKLNLSLLGSGAKILKNYIQNEDDISLEYRTILSENVGSGAGILKNFNTNSDDVTLQAKSLRTSNSGGGIPFLKTIENNTDDLNIIGRSLTSNNLIISTTIDTINLDAPTPDGTETKLIDGENTIIEGNGSIGLPYKVNVTFPINTSPQILIATLDTFDTDKIYSISTGLPSNALLLDVQIALQCKVPNNNYVLNDITTVNVPEMGDEGGLAAQGIGVQFNPSVPATIRLLVNDQLTIMLGYLAGDTIASSVFVNPSEWKIRLVIMYILT